MKLFYATSNEGKIYNLKRVIVDLPIEIITPKELNIKIEVDEDGETALDNTIKKANEYYKYVKMPVIAGDTAMYFPDLPKEKQPGTHVKRVNGRELDNESMINYYSGLANDIGGRMKVFNLTGIALNNEGVIQTLEVKDVEAVLVSKRDILHKHKVSPLDVITIDPASNKYYSEMTNEEYMAVSRKFDFKIADFLKKFLLQV